MNHRRMRHAHVIAFQRAVLNPDSLAVVMEYADGGEVFGQVCDWGRLSEAQARTILQQVLSAVAYMHSMQVAHRDLKLENVLLMRKWVNKSEQPLCKICDFGFSKVAPADDQLSTLLGTQAYAAPEIVEAHRHYDGKKVDVWAAGVLLYTMLVGAYPFGDPNGNVPAMLQNIIAARYHLPSHLSAECQDLLKHIFVKDAHLRFSVDNIRAHPWFKANLPAYLQPGVNEQHVPDPPGMQTEEELAALAEQAKFLPGPGLGGRAAAAPAGAHNHVHHGGGHAADEYGQDDGDYGADYD